MEEPLSASSKMKTSCASVRRVMWVEVQARFAKAYNALRYLQCRTAHIRPQRTRVVSQAPCFTSVMQVTLELHLVNPFSP